MHDLMKRWNAYYRLTRLDKPVGIWLLMWPTLWGLLVAGHGLPDIKVSFVFIIGTVLMRSAGCVLNDIADRRWDGSVERTRFRPLATGEVTVREAYFLASAMSILAFSLVWTLGLSVVLWSIPALLLAISYPYTKRFFAIPQAYLGVAFGFGIPMAFIALQQTVPAFALWLLVANICWSVAYDTEYAMVDREDDLKIGIRSSAITFGKFDVLAVMVCFMLMMIIWAGVALQQHLFWTFWLGWGVAVLQIMHQFQLIKARLPAMCFQAFLDNVNIGTSLTLGLATAYWLG